MMKCLFGFATLLLLLVGQTISIYIYTNPGLPVTILSALPSRNISRCSVIYNNNTVYSIYPELNLTNSKYTGFHERCNFELTSPTFDDAGNWTLISQWLGGVNNTVTYRNVTVNELFITESVNTIPAESYKTNDGNYLTVYSHQVFSPLSNCTLFRRINRTDVERYNLLNATQTNPSMERYGPCGVRLLVNSSRHGIWHIYQQSGKYKSRKFGFTIAEPEKYNPLNKMSVFWPVGANKKIGLNEFYPKSRYCTITRPDGITIALEDGSCTYSIPNVSIIDSGLWTLHYSVPESIDLLEKIYEVHVYDPTFVNVTVSTTSTQRINLLCRIAELDLTFCTFTKPDGTVINLPPGIGNDKYEYYGNGYSRSSRGGYSECGLTIRNATADDFGMWKCSLVIGSKILSAYVPTQNMSSINQQDSKPLKTTFVKRGDDFMLECKIGRPLDYCWLRSPNGTMYTVSNSQNIPNTLPYVGAGLAVGVCGARIGNASDAHSGNWRCRLGIVGSSEIEISAPVTVTDSYLHANQSVVNITNDHESILTCHILPDKDAMIKYCRWLRPDGYGIHTENSSEYFTKQDYRSCILTLKDYNLQNIGKWTCFALLTNDSQGEVFSTINVVAENQYTNGVMSNLLNVVAITLLTVTLVGSCIIGILLYRKKMQHKKQLGYCIDYEIQENEVKFPSQNVTKF